MDEIEIQARFRGYRSDDETCTSFVVFREDDLKAWALTWKGYINDRPGLAELAIVASGFSEYDGGPGRVFRHPPNVRRFGRCLIVTQFSGLDI